MVTNFILCCNLYILQPFVIQDCLFERCVSYSIAPSLPIRVDQAVDAHAARASLPPSTQGGGGSGTMCSEDDGRAEFGLWR